MTHRVVATALVVLAFGCSRPKAEETAPPVATGGGPIAAYSRATGRDRIARARCEHLQTCSKIAKGKTYDDLDSCFVHESAKVDDDLHDDRCATLAAPRLAACLTTVNEKKCDAFFTSWPDACERDALCK